MDMTSLTLLAEAAHVVVVEGTEPLEKTTIKGTATLAMAIAGLGAAIAIGLIGSKAAEATGRNPGAAGPILTIAVLGMALAEAIAIYAFVLSFVGIN